jgi:hypothetical protein
LPAFLLMVAGIILVGTGIYLFLSSRITIIYPVTITFELVSWSLALSLSTVVVSLIGWGESERLWDCSSSNCSRWRRARNVTGTSCVLLFIVT